MFFEEIFGIGFQEEGTLQEKRPRYACVPSRNGEMPGNVAVPAVFSFYLRALPVWEVEISGIAV
jgi:hypothetical protein